MNELHPPLRREVVRQIDQRAISDLGLSGLILMENAGSGAAEIIARTVSLGPVLIVCGVGNNGGDGCVIARHLDQRGVATETCLVGQVDRCSHDLGVNLRVLQQAGLPVTICESETAFKTWWQPRLATCGLIVDALLGTGLRDAPRGLIAAAIEQINASGKPVTAIDLPSGLDCDTGVPLGTAIRARETITFVGPKWGFQDPSAREWTGDLHVVPIGLPRRWLQSLLIELNG